MPCERRCITKAATPHTLRHCAASRVIPSRWHFTSAFELDEAAGSAVGIAAGIWFLAALVAMFFTQRYPGLDPFVRGTFRIYFGTFAAAAACFLVIGPGILLANDLSGSLTAPEDSRWKRRLTIAWCAGAGMILSLVLGAAIASIAFGILKDVKLWFVAVCGTVLLVPWVLAGVAGRWLIRRDLRRKRQPPAERFR
jgi:ABC-type thiamin/hydroxymethylpyrimidine transport system permease subunit